MNTQLYNEKMRQAQASARLDLTSFLVSSFSHSSHHPEHSAH